MVTAGELRHLVTIQRATVTRDSAGAETRTWATLSQAWAKIEPASGRELEIASAIQVERSHKIKMRYIDANGITNRDRIVYGARIFEIESVINSMESNEEVVVYANEVVA